MHKELNKEKIDKIKAKSDKVSNYHRQLDKLLGLRPLIYDKTDLNFKKSKRK